jgi:hypothetical protein
VAQDQNISANFVAYLRTPCVICCAGIPEAVPTPINFTAINFEEGEDEVAEG